MKTDIYTLLGMIKDGKPPKKIIFKEDIYEYRCSDCIDYYCDKDSGWLFDDYDITDILNDEVTILETTITGTKLGTIKCYKKGETDKAGYVGVVDKINEDGSVCLKQNDKIEKIPIKDMKIQATSTNNYCYSISQPMKIIINKINEIIDILNGE